MKIKQFNINSLFKKTTKTLAFQLTLNSILAFSIILAFASCSNSDNKSLKSKNGALKVKAHIAKKQSFTVKINSTGELLANEIVELKTPISGNVTNIYFTEGQFIKKGDLLVEIDNRSWIASKKGLESLLNSSKSELERKQKLLKIEAVSLEEVEQLQAQINNLKSQIEELEVKIDLSKIKAPFSGKLGMRNFSPGAYLAQGEKITDLAQTNNLKVHFSIPAKYANLAEINQQIKVVGSSSFDTVVANIYAIDPIINSNSRNLNIRALITNNNSLIAGDFVKVRFPIKKYENAILLPAEAVSPELNAQIAYVFKSGFAKKIIVITGERTDNRIQIISGINHGDTIITTGLMEVRDGLAVEIKECVEEVGI